MDKVLATKQLYITVIFLFLSIYMYGHLGEKGIDCRITSNLKLSLKDQYLEVTRYSLYYEDTRSGRHVHGGMPIKFTFHFSY